MTTIDEILKEIGYNDSPLRRDVKNAFKKLLQQKLPEITFDMLKYQLNPEKIIKELLKELE